MLILLCLIGCEKTKDLTDKREKKIYNRCIINTWCWNIKAAHKINKTQYLTRFGKLCLRLRRASTLTFSLCKIIGLQKEYNTLIGSLFFSLGQFLSALFSLLWLSYFFLLCLGSLLLFSLSLSRGHNHNIYSFLYVSSA